MSAPSALKGGILWFLNIYSAAKYQKREGIPHIIDEKYQSRILYLTSPTLNVIVKNLDRPKIKTKKPGTF